MPDRESRLTNCEECLTLAIGQTYDNVRLAERKHRGEASMATKPEKKHLTHFKTTMQADLPQGRNGKHKEIVTMILSDLDNLNPGSAIKVPLAELTESKEKVRSALNRATRKAGRKVMTASDTSFLYVWNHG